MSNSLTPMQTMSAAKRRHYCFQYNKIKTDAKIALPEEQNKV
jgi:hypothetical protein